MVMTGEQAEAFLTGVKLQFESYHKGVAFFSGEKAGHLIKARKGNMTYEDAYNVSFKAEENAVDFLDETISIRKDGIVMFSVEHDW
jgi:hypothetical protein